MRQILAEVPRGNGEQALSLARRHHGVNLLRLEGDGPDGARDLVLIHISNSRVEALLRDLQELPQLRVTLLPQGVLALSPPPEEVDRQVTDVEPRSPLEIFLSGLQSVGSWKSFLFYAAIAGMVVFLGLFTGRELLLVGAVLIAPFAGPAMNTALAAARGNGPMLGRSLGRYFASLAVAVTAAAALSLLLGQESASAEMIGLSQISVTAVLVPLLAGAVGALTLVQSDRNSLLSGAATGVMVTASLGPPAGILGMAAVLGDGEMIRSAVFLLLLQIAGIQLSGSIVFRLYGVSAEGVRSTRGRKWIFPAALATSLGALALLLTWQLHDPPELQRSSRAQRAVAEVRAAVQESGLGRVIEADVRFAKSEGPGPPPLLAEVYVQRGAGVSGSAEEVRQQLARAIQDRLLQKGFRVTPLPAVSVVDPPPPFTP